MLAAIHLPTNNAPMIASTRPRWVRMLSTKVGVSIRNPVSMKKSEMKSEFAKNASFSLAGCSCVAPLTASPARNAPTDSRKIDQVGQRASNPDDHHHHHEKPVFRLADFIQEPGAQSADAEQNEGDEHRDLENLAAER